MPIDPMTLERIRTNDPSLTSLDLSDIQIGVAGARALAEALNTNTVLTSLNLAKGEVGVAGAKALAKALKVNTTLISLNLSDNKIGVDGARALADALMNNASLTSLDLSNNKIDDVGVMALAEALKKNTGLTSLNLRNIQIGPEGVRTLAVALRNAISLVSLNLSPSSMYSLVKLANFHTFPPGINVSFDIIDSAYCVVLLNRESKNNDLSREVSRSKSLDELMPKCMETPEPESAPAQIVKSASESTPEKNAHTSTFFSRHPNVRAALAVIGLVISVVLAMLTN